MKEQILSHLDSGGTVYIDFHKRISYSFANTHSVRLSNNPEPFKSILVSIDELGITFNLGFLYPELTSSPWSNVRSVKFE